MDNKIRQAIRTASASGLLGVLGLSAGDPTTRWVMKYTSPLYGGEYPPAPRAVGANARTALHISTATDFTWGTGCYVCPLAYPFSGAIYGRCGIVSEFDPTGWKIFDARDRSSTDLYIEWVAWQPLRPLLMLTVHANLANQYLRNSFRETFDIDCVVFPPDEINLHYTSHSAHQWLAVSDWTPNRRLVKGGVSKRFTNPKLVVVVAEDFEKVHGGLGRRTLIGPQSVPFNPPVTPSQLLYAHRNNQIVTVSP